MMDILVPMILGNQWLWAHVIGGVLLGKLMLRYEVRFTITKLKALRTALIAAILWEIGEWIYLSTIGEKDILETYSSYWNAIWDSIGDIIGFVLASIIVFI